MTDRQSDDAKFLSIPYSLFFGSPICEIHTAIGNSLPGDTPRPLTFTGRCQALGRVGRYRPYVVWASIHVPMRYGLRFYVGSPYHIGSASAHSAT